MLHANRIIVLAPHAANEALGCGGWLSNLRREESEAPDHEKETSTMTTRLVLQKIQFYGDTLVGGVANGGPADGDILFPFRRLCEEIGVNRQSQERALRAAAWAVSYKVSLTAVDGKTYLTTCVDLGTPPGWLMMLNPNDVRHAAVRDKSMLYKEESVDEERSADIDEEDFRWRGRRPINRRIRRQTGAWQTDAVVAPHGSSPCATRGSIQTRSGSASCRPS